MKRFWIVIVILILAAGAVAAWWVQRNALPWTTDSPEALAELQAGLDSWMKFYYPEAQTQLERAVELDPDFVAPRIFLLEVVPDREARERLVSELRRADPPKLNRRERFLLHNLLLRRDGDTEQADRALEDYLRTHPTDPFALNEACGIAWDRQEFDHARSLYERLIEVDPNWVRARNNLGYVAMALGRFEEAERQFETYAYIAPDQPNPHDSMAELLTLLGRYDEARDQLERALALRPDFCLSYAHLLMVEILSGQMDHAAEIPDRARRHCDEQAAKELACALQSWNAAVEAAPAEVWARIPEDCRDPARLQGPGPRAALAAGDREAFWSYLERLQGILEENRKAGRQLAALRGVIAHYEGIAAFASGHLEMAAHKLEAADGALTYHGIDDGALKLANRADLARVQDLLGDPDAAGRTRASITEVNPAFLEIGDRVPLYSAWP
ncbi:MAG: tetratricopeptide repeat protein [Thermoanaerobaculia bacterium]